jgi:hypothetical protein
MTLKITTQQSHTQKSLAVADVYTLCKVVKDERVEKKEPGWLPGEIIWYYLHGNNAVVHCIGVDGLSYATISKFGLKEIIVEELKPGDSLTIEIK